MRKWFARYTLQTIPIDIKIDIRVRGIAPVQTMFALSIFDQRPAMVKMSKLTAWEIKTAFTKLLCAASWRYIKRHYFCRDFCSALTLWRQISWPNLVLILCDVPSWCSQSYVPTLIYAHELWIVTESTRSQIQVAEMSFLRRVAGHLGDRVSSSVTTAPPHPEEPAKVALGSVLDDPGHFPREVKYFF